VQSFSHLASSRLGYLHRRLAHGACAVALRGGAPVLAGWTLISVVPVIFLARQAIPDYVLSPYLIASRTQLNPVWVIFAIAAFGYLFGSVGLLIAVPLAAFIGVLLCFATREYLVSELEPTAAPTTVVSASEFFARRPASRLVVKASLSANMRAQLHDPQL
jgi:uncharacterized membrane protein YraQ (UPF0718 family)